MAENICKTLTMLVCTYGETTGVNFANLERLLQLYFNSNILPINTVQLRDAMALLKHSGDVWSRNDGDEEVFFPSSRYLSVLTCRQVPVALECVGVFDMLETYVPTFAAGFVIGKGGQFLDTVFYQTGVRVLLYPWRCTYHKAVLKLQCIPQHHRREAVVNVLNLLRRRVYALYFSYTTRHDYDVKEEKLDNEVDDALECSFQRVVGSRRLQTAWSLWGQTCAAWPCPAFIKSLTST